VGFKPDLTHGGTNFPGRHVEGGILLPDGRLLLPNEFEIRVPSNDTEPWHGYNGVVAASVLREGEAKMFKTNAIKASGSWSDGQRKQQWLCLQLDNVRTYVRHEHNTGIIHLITTKMELNP